MQVNITGNGDNRRTLVVVFLRGGTDGLTLVPPAGDSDYQNQRPLIKVDDRDIVNLEGEDRFGLHPLLEPLLVPYKEGQLAVVHCVGTEDTTRSHFEAQDLMEHGGKNTAGGWLGRFLRTQLDSGEQQGLKISPLSAVALGQSIPESLRGAPSATALESLNNFSLGENTTSFTQQLESLYRSWRMSPGLSEAGLGTIQAMKRIEKLDTNDYQPENGAEYRNHSFSQGLRQVAQLIKARVGLDVVSLDLNGWDSHFGQLTVMGQLLSELAHGLSTFYRDLGRQHMETVSLVVMTEFGRRLYMNSSLGTDHGRGSVMFIMGGGVNGGQVISNWKGLKSEVLEGPGDLPVTTNYRNVLVPILKRHRATDLSAIFPKFELSPLVDL